MPRGTPPGRRRFSPVSVLSAGPSEKLATFLRRLWDKLGAFRGFVGAGGGSGGPLRMPPPRPRIGHRSDGNCSRLCLRVVVQVCKSLDLGEWPQKIGAIGRLVGYGSLAMTIVLLCCVTCGVLQNCVFNAPPISRKFTYYSYAKRTIFCT